MTTSRSRFRVRFSISVERVQASYVSQQPCKRYSTGHRWLLVVSNRAGKSSRTFTSRPTAGESIVRSHIRPLTCSLDTIRGDRAGGVAEAGSSGSPVGASGAAQPAAGVKITRPIASHQGRGEELATTPHLMTVSTYRCVRLASLASWASPRFRERTALDLLAPVFEANLAELEGGRGQGRVDHTGTGDLRIDKIEARRRLAVAE